MIHFTYQTKNLINGKTYIGVHSTEDVDDGYLGCGCYSNALNNKDQYFPRALQKYGVENFRMIPLCFFDTAEEAYEEEGYLVDKDWVKRSDNYNIALGGQMAGRAIWGSETHPMAGLDRPDVSDRMKRMWKTRGGKQIEGSGRPRIMALDTYTGIFWDSLGDACESIGKHRKGYDNVWFQKRFIRID